MVATTAFSVGFTSEMRRLQLFSSSTGEIALVPMRRRSSTVERSQMSDMAGAFEGAGLKVMTTVA